MNLYAESSAVLSWLLGEPQAFRVYPLLTAAELIISSDLMLIECDRAFIRSASLRKLTEDQIVAQRKELQALAGQWNIFRIGKEIVERARSPFPAEPIRALDAIHLASALAARVSVPDLEILSLDERIRNAARQLGFSVQPD